MISHEFLAWFMVWGGSRETSILNKCRFISVNIHTSAVHKNWKMTSRGIQNHAFEIRDKKKCTFLRAAFSSKVFTTQIFQSEVF
jgi:hypothetical protein